MGILGPPRTRRVTGLISTSASLRVTTLISILASTLDSPRIKGVVKLIGI